MKEPPPGSWSGWIAFWRWDPDGNMTATFWAPNGCWVHSGPPKAMRKEWPTDNRAAWCECQVEFTSSLQVAQENAYGYTYALGDEARPVYIEAKKHWREKYGW
jgi:hypothetical protein